MIEITGDESLPPDDQFANPTGENPVSIIFPSADPGDGDDEPQPTKMAFDPGYFFQPTLAPLPHLHEFPPMEFVVPPTPEGGIIAVYSTPITSYADVPTQQLGVADYSTPIVVSSGSIRNG